MTLETLLAADPRSRWGALDLDERTAAYDNNAAVANSDDLIRRRNERAAARRRAASPEHLDLAYGPTERHCWDIYPSRSATAPCLAFIHGGYWQRNGREQFAHLGEGVAAHGWSFACLGYPLAPASSLTEIVAAVDQGLTWLQVNGPEHGVEGALVLAGWSAGAHLAMLELRHPAVSAALAISGVFDLAPIAQTHIGSPLHLSSTEIEELSPLRTVPIGKPATVAFAEKELPALAVDSVRVHEHRRRRGAESTLLEVPGADHFTILDALEHPEGLLTRAAVDLVH
ncbi:MAG TPA: alpha/beta hydrolase [Actinopolymorphaceae bacterium]